MPLPRHPNEWHAIADGFMQKWNFPHTCGAIDGKQWWGSIYYNYKKFFSVVLMALVDPDYKFVMVDIGGRGAASDGPEAGCIK